jgi:hypothetical protein
MLPVNKTGGTLLKAGDRRAITSSLAPCKADLLTYNWLWLQEVLCRYANMVSLHGLPEAPAKYACLLNNEGRAVSLEDIPAGRARHAAELTRFRCGKEVPECTILHEKACLENSPETFDIAGWVILQAGALQAFVACLKLVAQHHQTRS